MFNQTLYLFPSNATNYICLWFRPMERRFTMCEGPPGCFPLSVGRLSDEAGAKDTDEERDGRREKNSCRQFRGSREPHLTARKR
ncbi:hypothetical protein TNCT_136481 [Trichonephila clavata]|uniref:Uncharacterized protein n=1 Tax=Trichonephila clavata TaxID=2740835 RepID=A0A8X6FLX3_TRICU|nr:hypothetical protein TNCT_136481 [Trichonephila clavata]